MAEAVLSRREQLRLFKESKKAAKENNVTINVNRKDEVIPKKSASDVVAKPKSAKTTSKISKSQKVMIVDTESQESTSEKAKEIAKQPGHVDIVAGTTSEKAKEIAKQLPSHVDIVAGKEHLKAKLVEAETLAGTAGIEIVRPFLFALPSDEELVRMGVNVLSDAAYWITWLKLEAESGNREHYENLNARAGRECSSTSSLSAISVAYEMFLGKYLSREEKKVTSDQAVHPRTNTRRPTRTTTTIQVEPQESSQSNVFQNVSVASIKQRYLEVATSNTTVAGTGTNDGSSVGTNQRKGDVRALAERLAGTISDNDAHKESLVAAIARRAGGIALIGMRAQVPNPVILDVERSHQPEVVEMEINRSTAGASLDHLLGFDDSILCAETPVAVSKLSSDQFSPTSDSSSDDEYSRLVVSSSNSHSPDTVKADTIKMQSPQTCAVIVKPTNIDHINQPISKQKRVKAASVSFSSSNLSEQSEKSSSSDSIIQSRKRRGTPCAIKPIFDRSNSSERESILGSYVSAMSTGLPPDSDDDDCDNRDSKEKDDDFDNVVITKHSRKRTRVSTRR